MNLQSNDFELFGIPARFAQSRAELDRRWRDLQRQAHPDRFSQQGAAAQRIAMQWSVRINEAYQRLRDPLKRAAYLCELNGAPVHADNNTAMPAQFLQQQMAWRESLDDAAGVAELKHIGFEVARALGEALQRCEQLLDVEQDYGQAVQQVRAWMFIERLVRYIEDRLDASQESTNPAVKGQ
ncbi:MAG: Fe-S protein assembly co-chaperone HscB [Burkholderiaceae bacterium]|nr:MAG: Fe-S protein assembly co-chaperone HscB [Burkholderiaceae bacterium]